MNQMAAYLRQWEGQYVQIERGGPDACQGWLDAVCADYIALRCYDGSHLYFPLHHIRSVTLLPPPEEDPCASVIGSPLPPRFAQLVETYVGQQVRLYHSGPEMSVGILKACAEDHLLLEVAPGELVCFQLFHVRSLYPLSQGGQAPLGMEDHLQSW